jgi:hypothetical protein
MMNYQQFAAEYPAVAAEYPELEWHIGGDASEYDVTCAVAAMFRNPTVRFFFDNTVDGASSLYEQKYVTFNLIDIPSHAMDVGSGMIKHELVDNIGYVMLADDLGDFLKYMPLGKATFHNF